MWLIEIEINGTVHHTSTEVVEDARLNYIYLPAIIDAEPIRVGQDKPWGGLARVEYGSLVFVPDLFKGADWPPPTECPLSIRYMGDTGASFPALRIHCIAHLDTFSRNGVVYQLRPRDPLREEDTDPRYQDTLVNIFAAAIARFPGWQLNSAGARSPSPNVDYLASESAPLLEHLSEMAAFHAHRIAIDEELKTVYLYDTTANFTTAAVDESTYAEVVITAPAAWSAYEAMYALTDANLYQLRPSALQDPASWAVSIAEVRIQTDPAAGMRTPTAIGATPAGDTGFEISKAADGNPATAYRTAFDPTTRNVYIEVATGNVSMAGYELTALNAWSAPKSWELSVYDPHAAIYRSFGEVNARETWSAGSVQSYTVPDHQFPVRLQSAGILEGETVTITPVCVADYNSILSALYYIKATVECVRVRVTMPVASWLPLFGQYVAVGADSGFPIPTPTWLRIDEIIYNIMDDTCQIGGYGGYA